MPIVIIVEDGSIVPDANSYCTVSEARSFCAMRGVSLSANDDDIAVALIKAADYIGLSQSKFAGERVNQSQPMDWPRCVRICGIETPHPVETSAGFIFEPTEIPKQLKTAQMLLVSYQSSGVSLTGTISPSDYIIEDTIGPITTKYSDPSQLSMATKLPLYDAALSQLYDDDIGGGGITVRRV